jgi:alpha-L-fucosidase 2
MLRLPNLPFLAPYVFLTLFTALPTHAAAPARGCLSLEPAKTWEQAMVTGNGLLGAMVYGIPLDETIIVNHGRLFLPMWLPMPPPDTASRLPEIRHLLADAKYRQAANLVVETANKQGYGCKRWTDPFIPACDLNVVMTPAGSVRNYERSVDFATGVAAVNWTDERGTFSRRVFASRADGLIAMSIGGPAKGSVGCRLQLATRPTKGQGGGNAEQVFKDGIGNVKIAANKKSLTYRSSFRKAWPGSPQGYEVAAQVISTGGTTTTEGDAIVISGADEVVVLLRVELLDDFSKSRLSAMLTALDSIKPDFTKLLARHVGIHGPLFKRVNLDLGGSADSTLPSEQLIAKSRVGTPAPALLEKVFDAARYTVISSSGEVFPNLQGIWTGTWDPRWSSDFTLNGNVQSALAANLSGNFAEGLKPYFRFLDERMADFRENARRLYGCRGIHLPSRASSHGLDIHFDGTWPMTFWHAGAAWAAQFYYDYTLYTGDRAFLKTQAVPFMKEAALFYEDFLIAGPDGKLLFNPSYSPENEPSNTQAPACINATMDVAAARELLTNLIAACKSLGTDADAVQRWHTMLDKLPAYQINGDGALKEWTTPLLQDSYAHRHVSHLYPLFAGLPADIAANPSLRQAFRIALDKRMAVRRRKNGGDMAFGLVQMGLAAASLRDAGTAYEVVDWLANKFWGSNMVSTHDPKNIFNTDICGGFPAVVLRMLVDSCPGRIDLLPALPPQWPAGTLTGARCRGNIEVRTLQWTTAEITATLRSATTQTVDVAIPGEPAPRRVALPAAKDVTITAKRTGP